MTAEFKPICRSCQHLKNDNCRKFPEGYPTDPAQLNGVECIGFSLRADIGQSGEEITDRTITDRILSKHEFYCDREDKNLPLYIFNGKAWNSETSEGCILEELADIFAGEDNRNKMAWQKTIDYIKGASMKKKLTEKPPHLIVFNNGMYDVNSDKLLPHDKSMFYVNVIPHDYAPEARCPNWLRWLSETLRIEDLEFIQEWVGYALWTGYPEAAFLVLVGPGQNGKTIFMNIFTKFIGEKNKTNLSLADLTYLEYGKAELYHKLALISDDIGNTVIKNASNLKEASSGSWINARKIYGSPFDFLNRCKPTFSSNEPPEIKDKSDATKFRLKVIEFPFTFSKTPNTKKGEKLAMDKRELEAALEAEMPGIINWAIEGLKRLIKNNFSFTTSRSLEETWNLWKRKSTPAISYAEECWEITGSDDDVIERGAAYVNFLRWVGDARLKVKVSKKDFFATLKEEGFDTPQLSSMDGKRCFVGVRLKNNRITDENFPYNVKNDVVIREG